MWVAAVPGVGSTVVVLEASTGTVAVMQPGSATGETLKQFGGVFECCVCVHVCLKDGGAGAHPVLVALQQCVPCAPCCRSCTPRGRGAPFAPVYFIAVMAFAAGAQQELGWLVGTPGRLPDVMHP